MASSISSIIDLLLSVFRFLSDFFDRKRSEKDELKRLIEEKQKELDEAIDQGRITDITELRRQLLILKEKYESGKKGSGSASLVAFFLAVGFLVQGCFSTPKEDQKVDVIVVGERILVVNPGDTVPPLVEPAKTWYLVDSEAMKSWLNVTWTLGAKDKAE